MRGNKEKITNELIRKAKATVKELDPDVELYLSDSCAEAIIIKTLIGISLFCCQERLTMKES
jgi:hypothetical protein